MRQRLLIAALAASFATPFAHADEVLNHFLPPDNAVKESLFNSPEIQSARAQKQANASHAQAIDAGNAEFNFHTLRQRRLVPSTSERFTESSFGIERPLRLWGKRDLDQKLAIETASLADIEYADAIHEASRALLKHWFAWVRAQAQFANAQTSLEIAQHNARLANTRLKHGEISQLDADLAHAELLRAQAAWQTSQADSLSSRANLQRRYPELSLTAPRLDQVLRQQDMPSELGDTSVLREDFVASNHELMYLRKDAQRLQLQGQRADKDRYSDPTLGVFSTRERDGAEQITGVSVSFAFPGAARSHLAQAALSQALAAQEKVQASERALSAEFEGMLTQYQYKRTAALQLREAANSQTQAAEKSRTAFSLGEHSMTEMLQSARLANDQRLAADLMHLEVLELRTTIELDLHRIYDFD